MSRPAILALLRSATDALHRELDRAPVMAALMREDVNAAQLRAALQALSAPQAHAEAEAEAFIRSADGPSNEHHDSDASLPAWAVGHRHPLLLQDLQALGSVHARDITPAAAEPPASLPAFVGLAYVLEGSRLGAQVIARHIARHAPHLPNAFHASAAHDPQRWPRFIAWSAAACRGWDAARTDAAQHAAQRTMASFLQACRATPVGC